MNGLSENDLDHFSHVLTGYVGSQSFLEQVYRSIIQLKKKNPELVFGEFVEHKALIRVDLLQVFFSYSL